MRPKRMLITLTLAVLAFSAVTLIPNKAVAHCDTMNGPVVKAAQKALETGNVNLVLIWVQKKDEAEIKRAFEQTLAVRKLSAEAKKLADMYFFETLVRIHRAGEGAPYTGLKPASYKVDPGVEAADRAIEKGSVDGLMKNLTDAIHQGVLGQFKLVMAKKNFRKDDVEAGRDFVKAYVVFIHYVERLYQSTKQPVEGHYHETEETSLHEE